MSKLEIAHIILNTELQIKYIFPSDGRRKSSFGGATDDGHPVIASQMTEI